MAEPLKVVDTKTLSPAERKEKALLEAAERLPDAKSLEIARAKLLRMSRKRRAFSLARMFIFVILPSVVMGVYLFFFATPQYKSVSGFSVHTSSLNTSSSGLGGLMSGRASAATLRDPFMVREFILSRAMLEKLDKTLQFSDHYKGKNVDMIARLRADSFLAIDDYSNYLNHVEVSIDVLEGILKLYVVSGSPEHSVKFANAILKEAEQQVNLLSKRIFDDQMAQMEEAVKRAEKDLEETRRKIIDLQIKYGELSPRETVALLYKSIQAREEKLKESELVRDVQLQSNIKTSPAITRLDTEIKVLKGQLADQRNRLVGKNSIKSLNSILAKFEYATIQKEIAQEKWALSLKSLEAARQDALRQRRYLTIIAPPLTPQFPERTSTLRSLIFYIMGFLSIFFVVSVFLSVIRIRTK